MKLFLPFALLLVAVPVRAQTVPLQLIDHVVGTEILNNKALPAGTEVWVVPKAETRAMRLRNNYDEVVAGLPRATLDRVRDNGLTVQTYRPTAQASQAYYVLARLPDGRLFQSYVKTGDAGMQPGFDAVQAGRISMGAVPGNVRARLLAVLPGRVAEPPATSNPPPSDIEEAIGNEALEEVVPATPDDVSLPAFTTAPPDSPFTEPLPVPLQEVEEEYLPGQAERPARNRGWLWFLAGLLVGGAAAYFGAATYYERLLRQQRENLMRYVPMLEAEEPADAPDSEDAREAVTGQAAQQAAYLPQNGASPAPEADARDDDEEER